MAFSRCKGCRASKIGWLCHAVSDVQQPLIGFAVARRHNRHTVLMLEGSYCPWVHVVRRGQVRLFKSLEDGRELTLSFAGPGDAFGLECLEGRPASCTAEVTREVESCALPAETLQSMASKSPAFTKILLKQLIQDLAVAHEKLLDLGVRSARERVAAFVLSQYRQAVAESGTPSVVLPYSRRQIADHLGLRSETVIRVLTDLHQEGVIRVQGRRLDIVEAEALANISR